MTQDLLTGVGIYCLVLWLTQRSATQLSLTFICVAMLESRVQVVQLIITCSGMRTNLLLMGCSY
uniref:Putative Argonaute protein n=1 Tax=Rhizophora mucronata TaxID=61149 RepID=A0A2P2M0E3_RHIMU